MRKLLPKEKSAEEERAFASNACFDAVYLILAVGPMSSFLGECGRCAHYISIGSGKWKLSVLIGHSR